MNATIQSLALLSVASFMFGCATGVDPVPNPQVADEPTETADGELSASSRSYVTLRADMRKCMAPMCGGYWVHDVNRKTDEKYVSGLDFAKSGLNEDQIAKILDANPEELVLRGKLGPKDQGFDTRPLLVYEAYRGMPGVAPLAGETFYRAEDRSPQISCFAAPCPNETATKLNATAKTNFDGYSVKRALMPFVDEAWLTARVHKHNAIVSASILNGQKYPGGFEQILDASQVFVRIDDASGPCPAIKLPACGAGQTWAYTRDADLCVMPDMCVADGNCPSLAWPHCADGYSVSAWRVNSVGCTQFACDPSFVDQF
jgi:hypothetical protein